MVDLLKNKNISITNIESRIQDFNANKGYAWYDDYLLILNLHSNVELLLLENSITKTSEIKTISLNINQLIVESLLDSILYYISIIKNNGYSTSDLEAQLDYFYSVWNKEANPYLSRAYNPSDEIIYNTENPLRDNGRYIAGQARYMSDIKILTTILNNIEYLRTVKYRLPN